MTRLVAQHRAVHGPQPVRILNCLGLRAQESRARALRIPFGPEPSASNGRRHVDRWLPIHTWTTEQVWATIRASGLPWHPAYDAGLARLSCVLCVLAPRRQLELAARLNPDLARQYAVVEQRIGHRFKADLSITEVALAAGALSNHPLATAALA